MEIKFNEQQAEAVKRITEDLIKGDSITWTLMGYAGTGKTTLANYIAEVAKSAGMDVRFIAPTNKAAEVLRKKGNKGACTVHHLLYRVVKGKFYKTWEVAEALSAMEGGHYDHNEEEDKENALIICDEASMLSDKLLNDIEEYCQHKHCKVLYMGDPFQLPPVGKFSRTVFDTPRRSTLTQVMRQGQDSAILTWATALRKRQKAFAPKTTKGDVLVEDRNVLWVDYLNKLKAGKDVTMVTWKNSARVQFNLGVRRALGHADKTLQAGEPIMGISNGIFLRNGETMNIPENIEFLGRDKIYQSVPDREKAIPINAEFYQYLHKDGSVRRLILVPTFEGASLAPQSLKGLYYWKKEGGWKKEFTEDIEHKINRYRKSIETVLNREVTICTYGYAVTAHKSQGSQWDEVYITGISKLYNQALTNARWLYTAVTRAASKVHMLNTECPHTFAWSVM